MTYNEDDIKQNIIELIQERDKYRLQALKYKEVLEEITKGVSVLDASKMAEKVIKEGDDV